MFTIKRIDKNVWGFGEFYHKEEVISYLIIGNEKALLFDSGMGIFDIKEEINKITELPIVVVNSHFHFDHIGGNTFFEDIRVFNHEYIINSSKNGCRQKLIDENYNDDCFFNKPVEFTLNDFTIDTFNISHLLLDREIIKIDPFVFEVIHTPGHSDDGICLYEHTNGYLFAGDMLYDGPIYVQSLLDYMNSLEKIIKLNIGKVFPGHNSFNFSVPLIEKIYNRGLEGEKNITSQLKLVYDGF